MRAKNVRIFKAAVERARKASKAKVDKILIIQAPLTSMQVPASTPTVATLFPNLGKIITDLETGQSSSGPTDEKCFQSLGQATKVGVMVPKGGRPQPAALAEYLNEGGGKKGGQHGRKKNKKGSKH